MERYHAADLRKGRYSGTNRIYHVIARTKGRAPAFGDMFAARLVVKAFMAGEELGRVRTLAFVVMPDHFHWLMQLTADYPLPQVVGAVKANVAHRLGRRLWQHGFYDRALRRDEDLIGVAKYIVANPLRAGLVKRLADYPHWHAIWL